MEKGVEQMLFREMAHLGLLLKPRENQLSYRRGCFETWIGSFQQKSKGLWFPKFLPRT